MRGRVSDPLQPLRAAHIPNAPGFAGGWLLRKHGGRQPGGWQFDFQHLYRKSGSVARYYDFAADLRMLVARQALPGYLLGIEYVSYLPSPLLTFRPVPSTARG